MRDLYYADNRDLVKWAVLVHIAHTHKLRSIIQVPYWRAGKQHHFLLGGIQIPGRFLAQLNRETSTPLRSGRSAAIG